MNVTRVTIGPGSQGSFRRRISITRIWTARLFLLASLLACISLSSFLIFRKTTPIEVDVGHPSVHAAVHDPCLLVGANEVFITSITRPFRDHASKRNWRHTFWQGTKPMNHMPLWVYTENVWEKAHGRDPLSNKDFPFVDCLLDVFGVLPSILRDTKAVDEFYEIRGTPGLNTRIMDGKVLMRKVAAIAYTLRAVKDDTVVIWVDVDVVPKPLGRAFLSFVRAKDISYLAETTCWRDLDAKHGYSSLPEHCLDFRIDTGVLAFKASQKTRGFANWWLDAYSSSPGRMLALARVCFENATLSDFEEQELLNFFVREGSRYRVRSSKELCALPYIRSNIGLNDIYTFALALHAFGEEIEHGWFAYKHHDCDVVVSAGQTLPGGHCHPCPATATSTNSQATALVSPFNAMDYLAHIKGGTGIMARQHTDRHEGELKSVLTTDSELLLPKKYFPITTHVDHRMACGDKRSKYGRVWSLNQLGH